jgi:5-methylcytosine-specific restriction endonuclease McrA
MDAVDRVLSVEYRKAIANDPCTYCGRPGEQDDHRLPLARGGTDHWWNLHRACTNCNQRKHTMTHEEFVTSGRVPIVA